MELQVNVVSNASIATNVAQVSEHYLAALSKYEGVVSTPETVKDDKKACAAIRKLKSMVSDERIAFDRAVMGMPCVKTVHDSLKAIEKKCDEVVGPYWESVKAVEDASKPPMSEVPMVSVTVIIKSMPVGMLDKLSKALSKLGIVAEMKMS